MATKVGKNISENSQPPRVAFYIRISTDEDHQKYSLGAQSERLEAFCRAQYGDDWRLHKIYRDTESGTHMNRPGLEEMLFDAEAKAFDVLLVFRVDRLSRKVRELAQMVDDLAKNGVVLKSITEPFDTANAAGKMMLQMLGVFAEFEHATIVERTKVGMEKKAKSGKWVGGVVPYGYVLDSQVGLVVHEEEAIIVRKIFKIYAFGRSGAYTICQKLNDAGHRTRSGKRWDKRAILHILKNPLYVGKLRWRDSVYEATHNALISLVLFDKVQVLITSRVQSPHGRRFDNGDERLLSGVVQCGRCNSRMVGVSTNKKGRKFPYYLCKKRWSSHDCDQDYVRADLLEAVIVLCIKEIFQDEQLADRIWADANRWLAAEIPEMEKEIGMVEAAITKGRSRINRYFEAFESGSMAPELCNDKIQDLTAQLEQLEIEKRKQVGRRERLDHPANVWENPVVLDSFEGAISAASNPQKKHLLRLLVKRVLVHDRQTIEVWCGLPDTALARNPNRLEKGLDDCGRGQVRVDTHYTELSPSETAEVVEVVVNMLVDFLKRSANPSNSGKPRKEARTEVFRSMIPDMRRVG